MNITDVVTWGLSFAVEGGPSTALTNQHFNAEAYDKIEATIPKDSVATTVDVQPGDLAEMQALMVLAESYADLTFTVDEEVVEKTLDNPLFLLGPGNIGDHLGATCNKLVFTNASTEDDNNVTIYVARTAVEPGT